MAETATEGQYEAPEAKPAPYASFESPVSSVASAAFGKSSALLRDDLSKILPPPPVLRAGTGLNFGFLKTPAMAQAAKETVKDAEQYAINPPQPQVRKGRDEGVGWHTISNLADPLAYRGDNNEVAMWYRYYRLQNPNIAPERIMMIAAHGPWLQNLLDRYPGSRVTDIKTDRVMLSPTENKHGAE